VHGLRASGAIPKIVLLLSHDNVQVQGAAPHALRKICIAAAVVQSDNAILALVGVIASNNVDTHKHTAYALANINRHNEAAAISIDANVMLPLVKLSSSNGIAAMEGMCFALAYICRSDDRAQAVALSAGAISKLVQLLSHDNVQVQKEAVHALRRISIHKPAAVAT